jgi:DNA-binding response OmpR family regulator
MARILVIVDDVLFVNLMWRSLVQAGHSVDCALDGKAGWNKFCKSSPDAVICDIVMPEQEGLETVREMRLRDKNVAIIAISGGLSRLSRGQLDVLGLVEKLGADATLKKPFELSELTRLVDRLLPESRNNAVSSQA